MWRAASNHNLSSPAAARNADALTRRASSLPRLVVRCSGRLCALARRVWHQGDPVDSSCLPRNVSAAPLQRRFFFLFRFCFTFLHAFLLPWCVVSEALYAFLPLPSLALTRVHELSAVHFASLIVVFSLLCAPVE